MAESTLVLRPGKERSLMRRHPWIYSGAVERVRGHCGPGDVIVVRDSTGRVLGRAGYNAASQIVGRMWTFDDSAVDDAFVAKRIEAAVARRRSLDDDTNATRLVYSESDGIPGLIVDRYDDVVVVQFTAATSERWRRVIVDVCVSLDGVNSVFERSDLDVRRLEGLAPVSGLLAGTRAAAVRGDQRTRVSLPGRRPQRPQDGVLSRSTRQPQSRCRECRRLPSVEPVLLHGRVFHRGDARRRDERFERRLVGAGVRASLATMPTSTTSRRWSGSRPTCSRTYASFVMPRRAFDLIVLDPPKLAASAAQVRHATRGYKDLNWLAFRLLAPGGHLATFSCSGAIDMELFTKVVAGAALDARREVAVVEHLDQASDHPVLLSFPESAYLKGLWCRAD